MKLYLIQPRNAIDFQLSGTSLKFPVSFELDLRGCLKSQSARKKAHSV